MPDAEVLVGGEAEPRVIRINGPDPTFVLASDIIRAAAISEVDPRALDFLEIAAVVFAADSAVTRGGGTRVGMGEGWRRDFVFRIPVRNPELWSRPDVTEALEAATEFLTEDRVRFAFVPADPEPTREPYLDLVPGGEAFRADQVILFSGGLDSFAGALETLATTSSNVVLVTHRSAQKVIPRQVELGQYLRDRFPNRVLHINVQARRKGQEARDATQRSRTLLFAALGQAVATTFGGERLSFYENGIVSHNLPITQQIVGTMATRTTHPMSLKLVNDLLALVWPDRPRIVNRYEWLTKTEVVRRIAEQGGATQIPRAVSCTSIREQTNLHTHCGACTQCLDRRFAILAAGLADHDPSEIYGTDVLLGERGTTRSRTIAVEWTRHSLRLAKLDPASAMSEFGQEISRIAGGHPNLSGAAALDRTLAMHRRHSEAVRSVLAQAVREHSDEIVSHALPDDSLLAMHLRQDISAISAPAFRFEGILHDDDLEAEYSEEADQDAGDRLRVAFLKEGDRFVIVAHSLGRVAGQPAMVAHGLKPAFDADRAAGRSGDHHRYLRVSEIEHCEKLSKEAIRKAVQRCREELAAFYEAMHRKRPAAPLLIQNRPKAGYRLDPDLIPASAYLEGGD
ncbi:adenine nucleotide alpha hydrolase family protein [Jannaschia ovalis]|uniref:7-cyano-7-deazaguanine synthase (Queuosine biosynthesis) n=1 Tax=Jannaschia ovalis TaxID=3038773 RepID=A0ABY8LB83_9RHOB|nr:hypothetical protein [Jannaschia sp. GRR-S6-38]WGH78594.1 hypothetical protein P8627_16515 [Jannaschia sp. GRR-S6-38]